jgi:hypothetical protein
MKCFKKLLLTILRVGQKPLNGSHMSKFAKLQLRISNIQVTNCEVGEVKMWKKCIRSSLRFVRPIVQCMLMHFNCRFEREADCWKICTLSAEWWPVTKLTCTRTCKIVPRKDRRFLCKVFLFFKTKIQLEGCARQHHVVEVPEMFLTWERHWAWYRNSEGDSTDPS